MPINKKAMAVLTLSSIAFLLAVILFYSRTSALVQGAEANYLGETEIALYNTYLEGEKQLLFIDVAAQNSFRKAGKIMIRKPIETLKANPEQFLKDFSAEFAKYLAEFNKAYPGANLKIEDYTFKIDSRGLIGITEKRIMISTTYHNYTFVPNFRVFIDTGITEEISYEAVAADAERAPAEETTAAEPAPQATEPEEVQPLISEEIAIEGDASCNEQTNAALELLKTKAVEHYNVAIENVGKIKCVEQGSGMRAYDTPPTYLAGKDTIDAGLVWYAGTIAHDACHSKLYQDYKKTRGEPVPDEVWTGDNAEKSCISAQVDALKKLGASEREIDYLGDVAESEYWNVEYSERWW